MPTVPSTYLPPVEETTTIRRTTTRPRTSTTRKIITTPSPKIKIAEEIDTKEGYVYKTPKISFTLPQKPSESTFLKVKTPEPTVPVTYLPPVTERITTTTTRKTTTTTRKPTTTTQRYI